MTPIITRLTAVFGAMLIATASYAGGIDALKKFNQNTESLSGHFNQSVQSKKKTQKSSGDFHILRPGLFKWNYQGPQKQMILGDGKIVWVYDIDLKQITKSAQDKIITNSPAAILSNKSALETHYTLKEDTSSNGIDYVLATPKKSNTDYQSIRIGFRANQLAVMELKDNFGNHISIQFSAVRTNSGISRKEFAFTPPKGVDVLSQ